MIGIVGVIVGNSKQTRYYRHMLDDRLSLGLDHLPDKNRVRITFCLCRSEHDAEVGEDIVEDEYNKRSSREIINIRFDCCDQTLQALWLDRCVYTLPYSGATPEKDILSPLAELVDEIFIDEYRFSSISKVFRTFTKLSWDLSQGRDVSDYDERFLDALDLEVVEVEVNPIKEAFDAALGKITRESTSQVDTTEDIEEEDVEDEKRTEIRSFRATAKHE